MTFLYFIPFKKYQILTWCNSQFQQTFWVKGEKLGGIFLGRGFFFGGGEFFWGGFLPHFFSSTNLLVRVKLGYPPNFNFLGKPLLVEKYVEGRKRRRKKIMPSLVATTYALARKPYVITHYVRTNDLWEKEIYAIQNIITDSRVA